MSEARWEQLNRIWQAERDRQSLIMTGRTCQENTEYWRQQMINDPSYIPPWKREGFCNNEEYWNSLKRDNS